MTAFNIEAAKAEEYTWTVQRDGPEVKLQIEGTADAESAEMNDLLGKVHQAVVDVRAEKVVVDLRGLEFMSSACIKAFVVWIERTQALEGDDRYKIVLVSNPAMRWQRRSLAALTCFAADLVSVQTVDK